MQNGGLSQTKYSGAAPASRLKEIRAVAVLTLSGNPELAGKPESVDVPLPKPEDPETLLKVVAQLMSSWGVFTQQSPVPQNASGKRTWKGERLLISPEE